MGGKPGAGAQRRSPAWGASLPKVKAEKLYGEGQALAEQGKHEEARAKLRQALDFHRRPDIAGALGAEELELGGYVEAARLLSYALGLLPPGGAEAAKLAADLKRAKEHVATLDLRIEPAGARVTIDGRPVDGTDRAEVFVLAGAHTIRAELEGYRPVEVSRTFEPVVSERVDLVLPRDEDGEGAAGPLPLWPVLLGAGATVALVVAGLVVRFGVASGQENDADTLREENRAAGGCGAADAGRCAELGDAYADARFSYDLSTGLLIGGVATGVATVVYGVLFASSGAGEDEEPTSTQLVPLVAPRQVGLGLWMAF